MTDRVFDALLWLLVVASAVMTAVICWTMPTSAQEFHTPTNPGHWYPAACCNLRDCFEVGPELMTPTADGWRYEVTGEVIPYDRVRQTPAEGGPTFHVCTYGGNPSGQIIGRTDPKGHCAWAPPMGF